MYDHEIELALSYSKNDLPAETYQYICSTSPQILRVKYLPFENKFEFGQIVTIGNFQFTHNKKGN